MMRGNIGAQHTSQPQPVRHSFPIQAVHNEASSRPRRPGSGRRPKVFNLVTAARRAPRRGEGAFLDDFFDFYTTR